MKYSRIPSVEVNKQICPIRLRGLFNCTAERGCWRRTAFDQTIIAHGYRMRMALNLQKSVLNLPRLLTGRGCLMEGSKSLMRLTC